MYIASAERIDRDKSDFCRLRNCALFPELRCNGQLGEAEVPHRM